LHVAWAKEIFSSRVNTPANRTHGARGLRRNEKETIVISDNTQLHPVHINKARDSILRRFRSLNTPPEGTAKLSLFLEEMRLYSGGYFEAARRQLVSEQCIEMLMQGNFVRLRLQGYEAAQEV
jgi:hypothetical protein